MKRVVVDVPDCTLVYENVESYNVFSGVIVLLLENGTEIVFPTRRLIRMTVGLQNAEEKLVPYHPQGPKYE